MARKSGVEAATGEYIIFVDSDDYISVDLCSFIEETTQKEDADIIHFSSDVADPDGRNLGEVVAALKPLETTLTGNQVLESAYIEKAYATQIWGKVYKSALCKTVYNLLPTEHCYVREDGFTYFFLLYFIFLEIK